MQLDDVRPKVTKGFTNHSEGFSSCTRQVNDWLLEPMLTTVTLFKDKVIKQCTVVSCQGENVWWMCPLLTQMHKFRTMV